MPPVQTEITFDRVPDYGDERPGTVLATFEVPPPPWEQQQQQQGGGGGARGGGGDRWARGPSPSSSSFAPPPPPTQPLPPPPTILGFFSKRIDDDRERKHLSFNTREAAAALLPVRAPPLPSDLNQGYPDGWRSTSHRASVSDVILAARAAVGGGSGSGGKGNGSTGLDLLSDCDIVTFRSNLRPIFGCSFDQRKEWTVDAVALAVDGDDGDDNKEEEKKETKTKTKKTVFLEIVQKIDEGGRLPFSDEDKFFYWGFKFESLCFGKGDEPTRIGRTEINYVMTRELPAAATVTAAADSTPLKLLLVAEMDGFDEELAATAKAAEEIAARTTTVMGKPTTALPAPLPPASSLVELKTLRWPDPGREWPLFNWKAPTWWLQCFLGGVDHLRLGGRDDSGALRSLDALEVAALPAWARRGSNGRARWTAEGIVEHGMGVLGWIVRTAREHEGKHLRFQFKNEGGFGGGGGGFGGGGGRGGGGCGGGGGGGRGGNWGFGRITATEVGGGNLAKRIGEALRDERVGGGGPPRRCN